MLHTSKWRIREKKMWQLKKLLLEKQKKEKYVIKFTTFFPQTCA